MTIFYLDEDDYSCREEVLGAVRGWYDSWEEYPPDEIAIELEGRTEGVEDRIAEIKKVIDWGIEIDHSEVYVEVKPEMEAHLHAILGYIRPVEEGGAHHIYDFTLLKCLVDLGIKACRTDVPWNGIHSFCRWGAPALDLYNQVQKYSNDYRNNGELVYGTNQISSVFFHTQKELETPYFPGLRDLPIKNLSLGAYSERLPIRVGYYYDAAGSTPKIDIAIIRSLLGV